MSEFKKGMKVSSVGNLSTELKVIKSVKIKSKIALHLLIQEYDDDWSMQELIESNNNGNGFTNDNEAVAVRMDTGSTFVYLDDTLEILK